MAEGTRVIRVKLRNGDVIRLGGVPENAKITFAPIQPSKAGYEQKPNALRIYTSGNNQLAVFVDVVEFRDESLWLERQVKDRLHTQTEKDNGLGSNVFEVSTDTVEKWITE